MSPISTRKHGDVLIVTSNNPPVNALGHAVREGLVAVVSVKLSIAGLPMVLYGPPLVVERFTL